MPKFVEKFQKKRIVKFKAVFSDFRNKLLPISENQYRFEELVTDSPKADAYITGSDQVWNTDFTSCSMGYLLDFLPKETKRVSYAASFGRDKLDEKFKTTFQEALHKFSAISVRENSGVVIVNDLVNKNATYVLDPTFLLSDYSEIIDYSLVPDEPYIFVYRLNQNLELTKWTSEVIKEASIIKQLPVYSTSSNSIFKHKEVGKQLIPTPGQLLGLIEKSDLFITNSFHGTVFSIIFKKTVVATARDSFPDKQNLRIVELLEKVKLDNRFLKAFAPHERVNEVINNDCDFKYTDQLLEDDHKKSKRFITNALKAN